MRKIIVVLVVLFSAVSLFSQQESLLPEDWHKMADTAWVITLNTAMTIAAGNSMDIATAKQIASMVANNLAVNLLGEKVTDSLKSNSGETITKIRFYGKASSSIIDEALFKEKDGTYSYYLAVKVTVKK
jgi:hypothetical protein